jgi:two-component system, NarL family, sensor histidine kinase BarA
VASPLDRTLTLAELVQAAAVGDLLESSAQFHRVSIALVDLDGHVVVEAPGPGGAGGLERPLDLDGVPLGRLVLGPCEDGERLAAHLVTSLEVVFHAGYARHMATMLHLSTLAATYEELAEKNRRLASAVERMHDVDRLKSNFLATISHELRTPLTSVIGYAEMLLEGLAGPLNREQRDYVQIIMEKGDQLLQLITGILDVSRVETGGLRIARESVDVGELVRSGLKAMGPLARRKRLELRGAEVGEMRVSGDKDKLRQVVLALIGNAVKFTPEGGRVEVQIEVGPIERYDAIATHPVPSSVGVRMRVADNGIGIAPEKQERIFEPFFQVDSSSTREYGGTGLGLTLVKSYVEAHGGKVWVDSQLGRGSSFTVTLPASTAESTEGVRVPHRRASSTPGVGDDGSGGTRV